jgi:hypothetical protein
VSKFPYILYWNYIFFEKFDGNLQYNNIIRFFLFIHYLGHDNSFIISYPQEKAKFKTIISFLFYFEKKIDKTFWLTSIREYFNNSQANETIENFSFYSQNEDLIQTVKKDNTVLQVCLGKETILIN